MLNLMDHHLETLKMTFNFNQLVIQLVIKSVTYPDFISCYEIIFHLF